jgi:hypothetical protein
VAFYGVMKELNKPLIIALRLKVINGKITESEHLLALKMRPDRMQQGKSIAPFAEDCERYENGGQTTHNKTPIPWPVDLGTPEANKSMAIIRTLSCTAQVDSQVLSFITRLWPRLCVPPV